MKKLLKSIGIRSLGIPMFAFIPGMGIGASTGIGWLMGGITTTLTAYSVVIIFFGVQLTWNAKLVEKDVEAGFRLAATKAADSNDDIKEALKNAGNSPELLDKE
jgi:hypothetical protein